MAQSGFTPISIYYSSTASATPTAGNLVAGELAINTADGKLFYKDSAGVVQTIASKGTGTIGGSNTQVQYNNAGAFAGSSSFVFDGTSSLSLGTGISGAASPSLRLGNSGSGGGVVTGTLSLGSYSTGYGSNIVSSSDFSSSSASYLAFGTTSTGASGLSAPVERMRIDSTGNVGIGTSSPAATKFHSYQTSGSTIAGLFQTNQTEAYATFQSSTTSSFTTVRIGATGDNFVALVNGSERMRINSSGTLLVGTTTTPNSISSKLTVQGQTCLSTPNTTINSSTWTTIVTMNAGLATIRDQSNGGTCLVLFDANGGTTLSIISQVGSTTSYTLSAPSAAQIQLRQSGATIEALGGSSRNGVAVNASVVAIA